MNLWFLAPELLAEIQISKDQAGVYRVCSHPSDKPKRANPEEIIRQLVMAQLRCHYNYPHDNLVQEHAVKMGVSRKRADIVVTNNSHIESIIETKQTINEEAVLQLQSYMVATGAKYGAVISLYVRKVFVRDSHGSFIQIPDLPMYQGDIDVNNLTTSANNTLDAEHTANSLIEALGIAKIVRVSNTITHLYIKGRRLKLSNTMLLNYNNVRKLAIQEGIILPSRVRNEDWDEVLSHLFKNAPEIEGPGMNDDQIKEQISISKFIEQFCEQTNPDAKILLKDVYASFVKWYKGNVENSEKYLPGKKTLSAQLHKNGFTRRYLGGSAYIYGLRFRSDATL